MTLIARPGWLNRSFFAAAMAAGLTAFVGQQAEAARISNPVAVFAGLDKITGRITKFDVYLNETVQFGALQVTPRACYSRDDKEAQQVDGFVEVDEITLDRKIRRIFTGWMFAASPGLNAVEHPIYDVWLTGCKETSDVPPPDGEAKPVGAVIQQDGPDEGGSVTPDTGKDVAPAQDTATQQPVEDLPKSHVQPIKPGDKNVLAPNQDNFDNRPSLDKLDQSDGQTPGQGNGQNVTGQDSNGLTPSVQDNGQNASGQDNGQSDGTLPPLNGTTEIPSDNLQQPPKQPLINGKVPKSPGLF